MSDASGETEPKPASTPGTKLSSQSLVLKNAMFLLIAQALATPLSVAVNAMMGRYLGAEDFGYFYLATTFLSFGFLFVEWGQSGMLPAMVARDRGRAGVLLGSGLAWRLASAPLVYLIVAGGCHLLGYARPLQSALLLVALSSVINTLLGACQDTVRGFERTDIAAYSYVGQQFLIALLIIPALLLGGKLSTVLLVFAVCGALVLAFVWRQLRPVGVGKLHADRTTVRVLLTDGWPFLLFGLSMALQPNIDAIFLSKLAPTEAVGWHAAARKLIGMLVYPANALISALYPTLCRLYVENKQSYAQTTSGAFKTASLLVVPVALACFLYADLGVKIFSEKSFGPAADNLRILSVFIFLVYFSMPLGSALLAAGRQRAWSVVQMFCIAVSLVCDPLLVPYFQRTMGNGGLGICVATVASEVLMVAGGLWLIPRGIFDRSLVRSLALTLLAGAAMVGVARLLHGFSPFISAPLALIAYAAALLLVGGIDKEQLELFKGMVARKTARR